MLVKGDIFIQLMTFTQIDWLPFIFKKIIPIQRFVVNCEVLIV